MPCFDIVSQVDMAEVDNAIAGIRREVDQRFDFKGSNCSIDRAGSAITVLADDDLKLRQMHELIKVHCTRRKVDPGVLEFGAKAKASGDAIRQSIRVKDGIESALAKKISREIKSAKLKVQVAIQGDELRVTGKKRDDLQAAIAHVKGLDVEQPLQYVNFRD